MPFHKIYHFAVWNWVSSSMWHQNDPYSKPSRTHQHLVIRYSEMLVIISGFFFYRFRSAHYHVIIQQQIEAQQNVVFMVNNKANNKQETCRSIKLRELSACGRFVSHTKATEHKCRMTAHGPSSTSQLRRPRMLRCHCLPPRSLHVLGAFGSLSKSHISFKVT